MRYAKLCAFTAIATLTSIGAAMAAATQVNIADPKNANRAARVEIGNRLAVQEVPPASIFHSGANLATAGSCVTIATAPATKAVIVRQVRVDVNAIGAVGGGANSIILFFGAFCNENVGQVSPSSVGLTTITFDPGLVLQPGEALAATAFGSPKAVVNTDGYTVDSAAISRVVP